MKGKIVEFIRQKDYRFIKEIGQGGTGRTVLLEDETINQQFICKKYSPFYKEDQGRYFNNFKEEIRLLHLISHKNIVRVFNYHLYPEKKLGYILMEHIKGIDISSFLKEHPEKLNEVFLQTIDGFSNLEENKILHRDIRSSNILVSDNDIVKIIDFGFGKKIEFNDQTDKSISLNWPYEPPEEFNNKIYDFKTEIYFLGKLFEEIIDENNLKNFKYKEILSKMTCLKYDERIESFFKIQRSITENKSVGIRFTNKEKQIYLTFADHITNLYGTINKDSDYIHDIETIINNLKNIHENSILEEYIQNNGTIGRVFIKSGFSYYSKIKIKVTDIKDFYFFIQKCSKEKQKVIINNLWQRLDSIERKEEKNKTDDLPF